VLSVVPLGLIAMVRLTLLDRWWPRDDI